jgi:hypothetical protein
VSDTASDVLRELHRAWPDAMTWPELNTATGGRHTAAAVEQAMADLAAGGALRLVRASGTVRAVLTQSEAAALMRRLAAP